MAQGHATGERRRGRRVSVGTTGVLIGPDLREEVTILDISEGGAMIETRLGLVVDEQLRLESRDWGSSVVTVRWTSGHRAGLQFVR